MGPDKDYSSLYGSAAQVIPILVLVLVVEARSFSKFLFGQQTGRLMRWALYGLLSIAWLGEMVALVGLMIGPAPAEVHHWLVIIVICAAFYSLIMATFGVIGIIRPLPYQLGEEGMQESQ